ncbi:MAG: DUF748 domain-containing protein [Syntrophaceae bacterium]|nr:DUF748 domain-containing protein [Syntrophaceae bacterium]
MHISQEDLKAQKSAKKLPENPGMAAKISSLIGTAIEKGIKLLTKNWNTKKKYPSPATSSGRWGRFLHVCRANPGKTALVALALFIVLALSVADALLAGPMRNWAERTMNSKLNGYTVSIARVRPHLWRLAFDLEGLVLVQDAHPDPPVADFGTMKFSMVVVELLRLKVAGDLIIERPALHINLAQILEEARTYVSLKDRGWQSAVESIYPIKLNRVKVQDGSLLYLSSRTAGKPLRLSRVFMVINNVRNIAAVKGTYPSPVTLEGVLFDTGRVQFKGAADFLREPYAAARGEIHLDHVSLDRLDPLATDLQLKTAGGFLSASGSVEYTPEAQIAHLTYVLLDNLRVDYVTSNATKALELKHAREAVKLARRIRDAPKLLLQVDTLKLTNSQIGFVNKATEPGYRVFMSGMKFELKNLSNQADQARSEFHAQGAFMGSGATVITGSARATASPADFDVRLKLDNARMTDLNGFLMANEGMDVADGLLSVYAEITVKEGKVDGYIKPIISDLKIYDNQKDKGKSFGKRVKMHFLQFLLNVFESRSTQEVATVLQISGSTSDPKAGEWQAILKLIGNSFSHAVLPGFQVDSKGAASAKP